MDFTGKQLLILLIVEHAILIWLFFKYTLPLRHVLMTIIANQEVLGKHNKIMNSKLDKLNGEMPS